MARDAQIKYPNIKIISIYAHNTNAFLWQCRSAIEKLGGLEKIWNYLEVSKEEFLKNYSLEEYYVKNIETMYTVCNYKDQKKRTIDLNCCPVPLSSMLKLDANFLTNALNNFCNITLLEGEVFEILNTWMPLHWPIDDTQDYYVFKKYPLNIEQN
jgi:hypothetical protein